MSAPSIGDYAIIGDCRSAALVSRRGAIDWLPWPWFDSPPVFGALLDPERGGSFSIRPRGPFETRRRYLEGTAVLVTTFDTGDAEASLTDAMPIATHEESKTRLLPESELVRVVTCLRGELTLELVFDPSFAFEKGRGEVRVRDHGLLGLRVETRRGLLTLRCDRPLTVVAGRGAHASIRLLAGESFHVSLSWSKDAPAVLPPLGTWTREALARTARIWEGWSARTTYQGPYREAVIRSALTVRLLSFAPSGAVVAALTTSLPETVGGANNWDYRYCWLRDAAFTLRSMVQLGHLEDAGAFADWLLHATRLTHPALNVLYDVFGRTPGKEREVQGLGGYRSSLPVRVGNAADGQFQLDVYGEVVDGIWHLTKAGFALDGAKREVLEGFGRYVCQHWPEPDDGIWEPREARRQRTHSLLLCWTTLDRLIDLQDAGHLRKRHRALFVEHRARIRREIEARGWSAKRGSYVATLDGDDLDATSLLLGWYGFHPAGSPRMKSTFERTLQELSPRPGLCYRNLPQGTPTEGAFGICSFWLSEHLARGGGSFEEASTVFEQTLAYANDVGLMSEEVDPTTGDALGNTPQVLTHVGLLNSALSLAERARSDARSAHPS